MAIVKLPSFDARAFSDRLKETLPKRPNGSPITVWETFPPFATALRALRDNVATHDVQLRDHKADLDAHAATLASLPAADAELQKTLAEARDALEALKARPF